jgi:hypothetical protein
MTIYGFVATRLENGCIIKLLSSQGHLLDAIEIRNASMARDLAEKFARQRLSQGDEFKWLTTQEDQTLIKAKQAYEHNHFCEYTGSC